MEKKLSPIARGRTAEIFDYDELHILKLFLSGIPAEQAEEEFRIARIVFEAGVPAAEPVAAVVREGRHGIVYRRIDGESMLHRISSQPWTVMREAGRMAEMHAAIHGRPGDGLPGQKDKLRAGIGKAPILTSAEKEQVLVRLDLLSDGNRLCHGDLHPDNILLDASGTIIDWMTGVQGAPAGDVARTMALLSFGDIPEAVPAMQRRIISFLRRTLLTRYIGRYVRVSGISRDDIDNWLLPVAAARLTEWLSPAESARTAAFVRLRLAK